MRLIYKDVYIQMRLITDRGGGVSYRRVTWPNTPSVKKINLQQSRLSRKQTKGLRIPCRDSSNWMLPDPNPSEKKRFRQEDKEETSLSIHEPYYIHELQCVEALVHPLFPSLFLF